MNRQLTTKEFKEKIRAIAANTKQEKPKKGYLYRCPICSNEVEGSDNKVTAQSIINGANKLAHAERLAEAARKATEKMRQAGIGFGETELHEALAQWEAQKQMNTCVKCGQPMGSIEPWVCDKCSEPDEEIENEHEQERDDLRDDGRSSGFGESYAERNT